MGYWSGERVGIFSFLIWLGRCLYGVFGLIFSTFVGGVSRVFLLRCLGSLGLLQVCSDVRGGVFNSAD